MINTAHMLVSFHMSFACLLITGHHLPQNAQEHLSGHIATKIAYFGILLITRHHLPQNAQKHLSAHIATRIAYFGIFSW